MNTSEFINDPEDWEFLKDMKEMDSEMKTCSLREQKDTAVLCIVVMVIIFVAGFKDINPAFYYILFPTYFGILFVKILVLRKKLRKIANRYTEKYNLNKNE
jgi:hypothetical protein